MNGKNTWRGRERSGLCAQAAKEIDDNENPVSGSKGEKSNTKQFGKD